MSTQYSGVVYQHRSDAELFAVAMTDQDRMRLSVVHPKLIEKVEIVLRVMEAAGHRMRVISGVRTTEQQVALFAQGRTKPGPIVTYLDGVIKRSNHQVNLQTKFGHAVDCAFLDDPDTPANETWDERKPWELYGVAAETCGLTWGGRWRTFTDRPHVELRV